VALALVCTSCATSGRAHISAAALPLATGLVGRSFVAGRPRFGAVCGVVVVGGVRRVDVRAEHGADWTATAARSGSLVIERRRRQEGADA